MLKFVFYLTLFLLFRDTIYTYVIYRDIAEVEEPPVPQVYLGISIIAALLFAFISIGGGITHV